MEHLTPERLAAYRDGETQDQAIQEHLAGCKLCRDRLAEARMTGVMLKASSSPRPPRRHPDEATLAAYFDQALSAREAARVDLHLRSCSGCAQTLLTLRRAASGREEHAPRPAASWRARSQVWTRSIPPSLGRFLVELVRGPRLAIRRLPEERMLRSAILYNSIPPPSAVVDRVSEARARYNAEEPAEMPVAASQGERADLTGSGRAEGETRFQLGPYHVLMRITVDQSQSRLLMTLDESIRGRTPGGIRLTLLSPDSKAEAVVTDERGRARLTVPSGESVLTIETPFGTTRLELQLRLPA